MPDEQLVVAVHLAGNSREANQSVNRGTKEDTRSDMQPPPTTKQPTSNQQQTSNRDCQRDCQQQPPTNHRHQQATTTFTIPTLNKHHHQTTTTTSATYVDVAKETKTRQDRREDTRFACSQEISWNKSGPGAQEKLTSRGKK